MVERILVFVLPCACSLMMNCDVLLYGVSSIRDSALMVITGGVWKAGRAF